MTSFHVSRMRRCLLAVAVAQALIAVPVVAQTAVGAQGQTQKNEADVKSTVTLKPVVVTAQRRSQDIQKVPISVTALNEAELTERGIHNVADLDGAAPGLTVLPSPGGNGTVASFAMRGTISGLNFAMYADTPISLYVDGVVVGKTAGNVFDLLDLERIEVLRGPQGTLYGRNTMAGAINLITRPPSGQFSGDASVGFGNYGSRVGKLMMDLPAMGKLKASVGGRVERRDGWVKTTPGSSAPELNNRRNEEVFADLLYDVTDNLSLRYRYDYSNVDQYPLFNQALHSDIAQFIGIPGIIVNDTRQTTASINAPVFERVKIHGNAFHATWKLGDAGTLKYIASYREMHWDDGLDLDGSPVAVAQSYILSRYHQSSNELQYLGSTDRWNWVGGLYSFDDGGFSYGGQQYFLGAVNYQENYGYGTRSRAAYGQVDYKLTDKLTLTAGLRRTLEQKRTEVFLAILPSIVIIPQGTTAKANFGGTSPMLSASYQLTPNNLVYVRYAEGFLSGGFNGQAQTLIAATTSYKPQKQKTYEIGSKNMLFDDRLSLNAAVYYNRVSNLQQQVFIGKGAAGVNILNVGESHSQGVELQTRLRATNDLTLGLDYAYLEAGFDKYMVLGVNVADNRSYQFAPRHTATLVLNDVLARTSKGTLSAAVDYHYTSKFYQFVYPFTQISPPSQLAGNNVVRSNNSLNGRIAFSGMNWGAATGEVAFWVKNATNKAHLDNMIDFGPSFANLRIGNFNPPRTFGVTVTARW